MNEASGVEEEEAIEETLVTRGAGLQCVDTLLDYMEQWDYDFSDIISVRNIRGDIRKHLNVSKKQKNITDYFVPQNKESSFMTSI